MNRVVLTIALVCGAVALVGLQGLAQADIICQHLGNTDPTTEGFTRVHEPPATGVQGAGSEFGVPAGIPTAIRPTTSAISRSAPRRPLP